MEVPEEGEGIGLIASVHVVEVDNGALTPSQPNQEKTAHGDFIQAPREVFASANPALPGSNEEA